METKKQEYTEDNATFEAFIARPEKEGKHPCVLIFHAWEGRSSFVDEKAMNLAKLGYVGCSLDMFGKGKIGKTTDERMAFIEPLLDDRSLLLKRALAGFEMAKSLDFVDSSKIAAIGFCFGGLCALDLARSGAEIKGVVSFHGNLTSPQNHTNKNIQAKILVLHGHEDPLVSPELVTHFEKEMTDAGCDWQVHIYGKTLHAFTEPGINNPKLGLLYNPIAEKRSFQSMENFLKEIFP